MSPSLKYMVRRARLDDLAKVTQLEKRVWKKMAASRRQIKRRFFLFPAGFLVAAVGNEIGGFCLAVRLDYDAREVSVDETFPPSHVPEGSFYVLYALTVNPVFRRQGIASRLVKRHLRQAHRLTCAKVQLVANAYSRRMFDRLGFQTVQSLESLFREFPDVMPEAVLMEKELSG